jgi:hypothetical protein
MNKIYYGQNHMNGIICSLTSVQIFCSDCGQSEFQTCLKFFGVITDKAEGFESD